MRLIVEELQLLLVKDLPLKFCGLLAHGKGKDGVCISLIHSNEGMTCINLVSWPSLCYIDSRKPSPRFVILQLVSVFTQMDSTFQVS